MFVLLLPNLQSSSFPTGVSSLTATSDFWREHKTPTLWNFYAGKCTESLPSPIKTHPTNLTTMGSRLSLIQRQINGSSGSNAGNLFHWGQPRALYHGLKKMNKIKVLSIYFYQSPSLDKSLACREQWWPKCHPSSLAGTYNT